MGPALETIVSVIPRHTGGGAIADRRALVPGAERAATAQLSGPLESPHHHFLTSPMMIIIIIIIAIIIKLRKVPPG